MAKQKQPTSFCGVNGHHQNGLGEKAIHDLQEQARMILLHAQARWPQAIHASLWPYVMKTDCYISNILFSPGSNQSQLGKITGVAVSASLKHTQTFGCPVFALHSSLAANKSIPKGDTRERLGVHLSPSPRHAWSMALVLNLTTGLISSQFHDVFNDFFETT